MEFKRRALDAHSLRPFGLCLSGGGIRSATFNLGILQGLAERGLLPFIDYLSTVSGGGYIGTWLHGVIKRKCGGDPLHAGSLISPSAKQEGRHTPKAPNHPTEDPITFLRKYSNYLAPRLGLLSADFWVIGIIWLRNMFLNQLILVPFLAGLVLVAIHAGLLQQKLAQTGWSGWFAVGALAIASLAGAVVLISLNLGAIVKGEFGNPGEVSEKEDQDSWLEKFWVVWVCAACVLLSALVVGTSNYDPIPNGLKNIFSPLDWYRVPLVFTVLLLLFGFLQWCGGFKYCFKRHHATYGDYWWFHLWIPLVCALATTILLSKVLHWITTWQGAPASAWHTIAWGPPLVVQVLLVGVSIQIGLMGADFPDSTREWLARLGALLTISFTAWMALFAISVFGPQWLAAFALSYGKTAAATVGGWVATTAAGVYAGKSSRTGGANGKTSTALEWIGKIAPAVFLIGYLLTISLVVHEIIAHEAGVYARAGAYSATMPKTGAGTTVHISLPAASASGDGTLKVEVNNVASAVPWWIARLQPVDRHYWITYDLSTAGTWGMAAVLLLGCAALVAVLPLRININEFSLHHFYKNRLVRCYLGASRGEDRRPNPFTGFDSHDDLPIAELRAKPPAERPAQPPYWGPYPILNTTLNLNAGSDLATQERKGASFVFSPLRCGFDLPPSAEDRDPGGEAPKCVDGYQETRCYMYPPAGGSAGGPAIGTAMAISGAAANPNGGYHTFAPLAFLMTIFDVRLGWWVGNPRLTKRSRRPGPSYALGALLSELFAQTTSRSRYLNLSDGGHFDNLGLYELVKRRCRYIIVCDGEEDPKLNFESLGGAIRKCRADLGVEIDLDPKPIQRDKGFSRTHCVVGSVTYPEMTRDEENHCGGHAPFEHEPAKGWILYLKASLTGDEPDDVTQYHAGHQAFPHEPTANQFFTESQFESYRRLGLHVVESAFENVGAEVNALVRQRTLARVSGLFQGLCQQWYPPSTVAEGVATRHAEAYTALMKRMSDDPDLRYLDKQIIPRLGRHCTSPAPVEAGPPAWVTDAIQRKAFFFCLDLFQLMENVWTDLHLDNKADRENPKNGGWMRMFRHWASQPLFQETWKDAGCTYNDLFRQFFDGLTK